MTESSQLGRCKLEGLQRVSIAETDCAHHVKPVVLFNYMQDLAAKSIELYNKDFSYNNLLKRNFAWFLIRYRVEFEHHPLDLQEVKIKTEFRGRQKMATFRDFEVFDKVTGMRILRAKTSWYIVDLEKKSVVNIAKEFPELLLFEERDDEIELQKLKSLDSVDSEKVFHVRYDDLDVNNHVNNTVYISWALEALDYDFRLKSSLKSLDIYFKKEVKYGDDIISQVKYDIENFTTLHAIKNLRTGEELCLLRAEYMRD